MKLQKFFKLAIFAVALMAFSAACVKEGPPGKDGATGAAGKDANETCKMCHTPAKVDIIAVQFKYSKHEYGLAAEEETGRTACDVCHTQEGFHDVVDRKVPSTFTLNTATGRYVDNYSCDISKAYGALLCRTCHSSIHETYNSTDLPKFTTTAPVDMAMWGGKKTINLTQDGGSSNLCIKCHQPRSFAAAADGNVLDYASLISKPTAIFFDAASPSTATMKPSYRTGTHYGTVGAIVAGMGGIEFQGTLGYASAIHATKASCADCHMATMAGGAGGHSFSAIGNFNGCNIAGCHTGVDKTSAKYWVNPRATIKDLLGQLGAKLKYNGIEFMNRNSDATANLWYGITTNNYDGYFNVYDPASNPDGVTMNTSQFQNPSPSGSWTATQKAYNLTLPKMVITNAQFGAIINFQLCLREYSLGIHNLDYTKALLTNSLAVLN